MEDEPEIYESDNDSESINSIDSDKIVSKKKNKKMKTINNDDDYEEMEDDSEIEDEYDMDENDDEEVEDVLEETADKPFSLQSNFPDLEEEDEEEDEDENYLQKFGEDIQKTIIQDHHPELHIHNNEEIDALTTIVRDANGNIIDPLHRTIPFVSRYEKARVLGERAKQLNSGAEPFVEIDETMIDGYLIALKEFEEKKIPFIIQRPLPNGACEYWKLKDLEII
jgi:DNA-directed RNA polymerase I, II, and III subunit RPABC2